MGLLRDVHPLVAEILDGKYDEILPHLSRAAEARMKQNVAKSGLRPRQRIRITEAALERMPEFVGREGKVERVNPKTISVTLDPLDEHDFRTAWRLPHSWLEAI
jgi:hypothetical protein